jgi:deoxyribodipyrimidine photolyase-related protein
LNLLLEEDKTPLGGKWTFDADNRKKLPANHKATVPLVFDNDVTSILKEIQKTDIKTI